MRSVQLQFHNRLVFPAHNWVALLRSPSPGQSPDKFQIAAGLGSSITLIGSPPNMIVNDALISYSNGGMKFGFFEYSKVESRFWLGESFTFY